MPTLTLKRILKHRDLQAREHMYFKLTGKQVCVVCLWVCGCVSVALLLQLVSVWMCFSGSFVALCMCVDVVSVALLLQFVNVWMCFSGSFVAACKCVDVFQWLLCCSLWVWVCFSGSFVAACKGVDVFQWLFCCSL